MTEDDILLKASLAITTSDTEADAGGAMGEVEITGAGAGEWMPKLVAPRTGTLDTDAVTQTQLAYVDNVHSTDDWLEGGFYMANLLIEPAAPGVLKATSTSASDGSGKKIVGWGEVSAALAHPDLILAGLTEAATLQTFTRLFRATLRDSSTGELVTAAGDIELSIGTEVIGMIPAGYSYATSEFEFAPAASVGDLATFADRLTPPGGLSWSRPNTEDTRIYVRNDSNDATLAAGEHWGIYCRETLQPGMESAGSMRRVLRPFGVDGS